MRRSEFPLMEIRKLDIKRIFRHEVTITTFDITVKAVLFSLGFVGDGGVLVVLFTRGRILGYVTCDLLS